MQLNIDVDFLCFHCHSPLLASLASEIPNMKYPPNTLFIGNCAKCHGKNYNDGIVSGINVSINTLEDLLDQEEKKNG